MSGDNALHLDMYARYRRDPDSVPIDWILVFDSLSEARAPGQQAAAHMRDVAWLAADLHDAYRRWGHLKAKRDFLGLDVPPGAPGLERVRDQFAGVPKVEVACSVGGCSRAMSIDALDSRLAKIYSGELSNYRDAGAT
jgi:2-oxoglutarate dehydrogenase E1 component